MIGNLNEEQINNLLGSAFFGHLGCHADNTTYVVPLSFVYHDDYIICHTGEGLKVDMMRKNPRVCFQVEKINNSGNWQSVIVQGIFEEVYEEKEKKELIRIFLERFLPKISEATTRPHEPAASEDRREAEGLNEILFKIFIKEKTGKFQKKIA